MDEKKVSCLLVEAFVLSWRTGLLKIRTSTTFNVKTMSGYYIQSTKIHMIEEDEYIHYSTI